MSCMIQSDDQISHLLPLIDMSRCGRSKETQLQVTCELPRCGRSKETPLQVTRELPYVTSICKW